MGSGVVVDGILVAPRGDFAASRRCRAWRARCVRGGRPYVAIRYGREALSALVEVDLNGAGGRPTPAQVQEVRRILGRYATANGWRWHKPALIRVDGLAQRDAQDLARALFRWGGEVLAEGSRRPVLVYGLGDTGA